MYPLGRHSPQLAAPELVNGLTEPRREPEAVGSAVAAQARSAPALRACGPVGLWAWDRIPGPAQEPGFRVQVRGPACAPTNTAPQRPDAPSSPSAWPDTPPIPRPRRLRWRAWTDRKTLGIGGGNPRSAVELGERRAR